MWERYFIENDDQEWESFPLVVYNLIFIVLTKSNNLIVWNFLEYNLSSI